MQGRVVRDEVGEVDRDRIMWGFEAKMQSLDFILNAGKTQLCLNRRNELKQEIN